MDTPETPTHIVLTFFVARGETADELQARIERRLGERLMHRCQLAQIDDPSAAVIDGLIMLTSGMDPFPRTGPAGSDIPRIASSARAYARSYLRRLAEQNEATRRNLPPVSRKRL